MSMPGIQTLIIFEILNQTPFLFLLFIKSYDNVFKQVSWPITKQPLHCTVCQTLNNPYFLSQTMACKVAKPYTLEKSNHNFCCLAGRSRNWHHIQKGKQKHTARMLDSKGSTTPNAMIVRGYRNVARWRDNKDTALCAPRQWEGQNRILYRELKLSNKTNYSYQKVCFKNLMS